MEGARVAPLGGGRCRAGTMEGLEGVRLAQPGMPKVPGWHRGIVWGCQVGTNGEAESVSLAPWKARKVSGWHSRGAEGVGLAQLGGGRCQVGTAE